MASAEPTASPSGRACEVTRKLSWASISRQRAEIEGFEIEELESEVRGPADATESACVWTIIVLRNPGGRCWLKA